MLIFTWQNVIHNKNCDCRAMTGWREPNNINVYYVKSSLYAVASAVNLNCAPQTYVCDGEEVVCNCTAPCIQEIHWWDNKTISFCSRTQLCNGNRQTCVPDKSPPVHVEVINCSNSDTFTSRLSYNASVSTSTTIQIGCSSSRINTTCSPEDPLDSESVTLPVRNCTGI